MFTIVVQQAHCCSVVTVNNNNTVQKLTFGCSTFYRFPTHASRTQRIWPYITVERSDERLNSIKRCGTILSAEQIVDAHHHLAFFGFGLMYNL